MLNISDNHVPLEAFTGYSTYKECGVQGKSRSLMYTAIFFFACFLLVMFLPWTQNIQSKGKLTTLDPSHRPQSIYATIGGRIEKWYVREGQWIKKGDTIAFLSEIKSDYFDPDLLDRAKLQVQAKEMSLQSYESKVDALGNQLAALEQIRKLKLEQTLNKIEQSKLKILSDSIELEAAKIDADIAQLQLVRTDSLYRSNIKSLTDFEEKRKKQQETLAKRISAENKLLISRNELLNAKIELGNIENEYADKIAKSRSDRYSSLSMAFDAKGGIAKLNSEYTNYELRNELYYILAPQDGFISKILKKGLGEIIKENDELVVIMPANFEEDLCVEMYINPMDYPLLNLGQPVRFIFDGWPAFVFSGWPGQSFGTFGGKVFAIDNMTQENGKYRILVKPDPKDKPWPTALRVGSGAEGMILMNDVPVWYELWRQLNGFPPDFYEEVDGDDDDYFKLKAPANHLKK